ncbi:MAG: OmpA family protein [Acidocella sp.]|nr:OmpA family protein [Acidocella sp.]
MNLRLAFAVTTSLALPFAAHAQPVIGPYVSLGAGTSILETENYYFPSDNHGGKFFPRVDYGGVGDLGYGFANGFRVQFGGNWYRNNFAKYSNSYGYSGRQGGGIQRFGFMANVLYDIPVSFPIRPYIGAGVGYQWEELDHVHSTIGYDDENGTSGSFAYDVIAGLSYPLPFLPGLAVTGEYRFMELTADRQYEDTLLGGASTTAIKLGPSFSHTFLLGLRYQLFNAPAPAPALAPAPVAAPAPASAKTYLVFFDWDKYRLTPRATQIIAQAAADSKTENVTIMNVAGYTDTSGTPKYNQGLSERRAKAVAAQLVADGVQASEIEIHGYGETHLLVQTGPGVREPQNRRVEIVMQ